jgi:hypothetical protein
MKKILAVLANSVRKGCHCIAGREMTERDGQWFWGPWIRPVSQQGEGEVTTRESTCSDGTQTAVLNVVEIALSARQECSYQPENYFIDPSCRWRKLGKVAAKDLVGIEERPPHLWLPQGRDGRTDRIHSSQALGSLTPFQSLYLIRPVDLRFHIWQAVDPFRGGPRKQRRAIFSYEGVEYDLPITDPTMDIRYFRPFPTLDEPMREILPRTLPGCLIVVSLAAPFKDEYHYKVVATVLEY